MFDDMILEEEQIRMLKVLVVASRNQPRDDRRKFHLAQTSGGDFLLHPQVVAEDRRTYIGDIEALGNEGLLNISYGRSGSLNFDVTPRGFRFYEFLHTRENASSTTLVEEARELLSSEGFRNRHSTAFKKWAAAEDLLWQSDSEENHTLIGHLCREALQLFADDMTGRPSGSKSASTVSRVRAASAAQYKVPSETTSAWLGALMAYWGTVSDLIQKQEHGAARENETLRCDDSRRVVLYSLLTMIEVDRAISESV